MQEEFHPGYVTGMQELHQGYQNTRLQDILAHVIAQCPVDPFMISKNKEGIKESRDASAPFSGLVEHDFNVQ